ncbi:ergothioneine biosynthesis glutamate--cysteine ligase EgtA [Nocardia callitridis]|uniref:Glutamate--cysteine ligase EgtA n=1 Tax=Nocardia callitridis TaxID=648753 RepID=A0ABP9JTN4_9NOCA
MAVTLEQRESVGRALQQGDFSSRAAAEAYVGGVCFKLGPPALIGAELEWLTVSGECPPSGRTAAPRPRLTDFADALGVHTPRSLVPDSPQQPLPGGSTVTLEPGGQIELSSAPFADATQLTTSLRDDTLRLRDLLATHAIHIVPAAADTDREPERLLQLPRYRAMEQCFGGIGPFGKLMMCNTAAAQVSIDAGADKAQVVARWTALYAVGPALTAAFACSPTLRGAPEGAWASQRMRTWLRLDHARTRPPVMDWADPIAAYSRWALDVPMLCLRNGRGETDWAAPPGASFADWLSGALDDEVGRRPDLVDLDYHLTTLFPPVRASGHLEVRYLDAQPGDGWTVPIHVFDALMSSEAVVAEATALAASTAGHWLVAARCGLADPQVRGAAVALLELAGAHAASQEAAAQIAAAVRRCRDGRTPTEERDDGRSAHGAVA